MGLANQTKAWAKLATHYDETKNTSIASLFDGDASRASACHFSCGDVSLDLSHTHMMPDTLHLLVDLAWEQKIEMRRDEMFNGDVINVTEKRAVLHTALRTQSDASIIVDGQDVIPEIRITQAKMKSFVEDIHEGVWTGATGKKIENIVNLGIGGSDLGPRFVVNSLSQLTVGPMVHFVANIDAAERLGIMRKCDPATTLFVMVSKTFTTEETIENAKDARKWIAQALGEDAVKKHFVAVTSNIEAAEAFGMQLDNVFAMWDWVGGRYSLWSAVGLSIALSIGYEGFEKLLAGAAKMDEHFRTAPLDQNIPVLMALTGIWYHNFYKLPALAVLPYSERLRDFPRLLQQLDMESNGKRVTRDGELVDYATGPIVFGECGTVGQHSFHQWLHQGPQAVLANFIGVQEDDLDHPRSHQALHEHRHAQIKALAFGAQRDDSARVNPGNKPVMDLTIKRHDPENIGMLLALFEHKVATQGFLWGINSFDQFGVQLGKVLVKEARN